MGFTVRSVEGLLECRVTTIDRLKGSETNYYKGHYKGYYKGYSKSCYYKGYLRVIRVTIICERLRGPSSLQN